MPMVLVLLFVVVVALVELLVIVQASELLGLPLALVTLVAVSVAGAALVRHEGTRAWRRFREALHAGRVPTREVVDGGLLLLAGALLLLPGFVSDLVGLALLVPPVRAGIGSVVRSRFRVAVGMGAPRGPSVGRRGPVPSGDGADPVDVEVVRVERTTPEGTRTAREEIEDPPRR